MAFSLRPLKTGILAGESFRIPEGARVLRVGRAGDNDLRVEHASVSALHAELAVDGDEGVEVVDCGSSNGTFVNGIRVDRRRLADGDLLRFATVEFRVREVAAAPSNGGNGGAPHVSPPAPPDEEAAEEAEAEIPGEPGEAEAEAEAETAPAPEPVVPLAEAEAEMERLRSGFAEERNALARQIEGLVAELASARDEGGAVRAALDRRDAESALLEAERTALDEQVRRLRRDLEEAGRREERLQATQSEARREVIEREGVIAGLRYELQGREGRIRQVEEERTRLQRICDEYASVCADLESAVAATREELGLSLQERDEARGRASGLLERLEALGARLLADWRAWIPEGGGGGGFAPGEGEEAVFVRVAAVADAIRGELDRIEPIWHRYGDGVQAELARRCELLREEQAGLEVESARRREELAGIESDLAQFRELMDLEVRRAQGLSRKGVEVEIPERFEAMTIARDREQEILRALVERLETLDQLLLGYGGSRKLREVHRELADYRERLAAILESGGVRAFGIETGTFLTPRHRREVQVLSRKGWGTKQYAEIPFQPGEVVKMVRPGYRVGEGDGAAVLRKVEVLIRGVED